MTTKINNILEELKSLTLLEAVELVKQIEETFDVDVSSVANSGMVMMPSTNDNVGSDEINEKTDFDVILEEFPSAKKIAVLKVVRSITGLGLKEAKELVESVPKVLKEGTSKEEAQEIKSKLEDVGGKVLIQ